MAIRAVRLRVESVNLSRQATAANEKGTSSTASLFTQTSMGRLYGMEYDPEKGSSFSLWGRLAMEAEASIETYDSLVPGVDHNIGRLSLHKMLKQCLQLTLTTVMI